MTDFTALFKKCKHILDKTDSSLGKKRQDLCDLLRLEVEHYDWVGFYFKDGEKKQLRLAEFSGEPTDHVIIPFGKGICGQVAESNNKLNVRDVSTEGNYIACGINVKSELVVPLFINEQNQGQIDIDSHIKDAFLQDDEDFLSRLNKEIARVS